MSDTGETDPPARANALQEWVRITVLETLNSYMAEGNGQEQQQNQEKEVCGLIMPISPTDGYAPKHWEEVKSILEEAIELAGFKPNMVSDANDVGIIHNRIVNNIYNNPIVVCDVSSKNPNVMFELGLRLAFDKATIIVKDDVTNYTFDTSPIEHLGYQRDLNYHDINRFKSRLILKIKATYEASKDQNYSTFLKNFVQYKRKLDEKEVETDELILEQIEQMNMRLSKMENQVISKASPSITGRFILNTLTKELPTFLNKLGYENFKVETGMDEFGIYIKNLYPNLKDVNLKPFIDKIIKDYLDNFELEEHIK